MKLFSALMIWPAVWAGTLVPVSLECEARRDPVGVGTAAPRLGWRLTSKVNGDRQTAYQVVAASSAELLESGKADLWDSGRVASGETEWIQYAGKALPPFARVHWKVKVWDAAGAASLPYAEWVLGEGRHAVAVRGSKQPGRRRRGVPNES